MLPWHRLPARVLTAFSSLVLGLSPAFLTPAGAQGVPQYLRTRDIPGSIAESSGLIYSGKSNGAFYTGTVLFDSRVVVTDGRSAYTRNGTRLSPSKLRWFSTYSRGSSPALASGVPLVGTARFDSYVTAFENQGFSSFAALNNAVVFHYAYQSLGQAPAAYFTDGGPQLLSASTKYLVSYALGLYSGSAGFNPHRFQLHQSGPTTRTGRLLDANYPFLYVARGLLIADGGEGGPVWVQGSDQNYGVAGVVVGGPLDTDLGPNLYSGGRDAYLGRSYVVAFDPDSMTLLQNAIAAAAAGQ